MLRIFAAILLASALVACDIETTPSDQNNTTNNEPDGEDVEEPFERMFVEESYGIGMVWFEYEKSTHALLPMARVYRFEKDGHTTLFRLKSYYNERGDSGHFSIERRMIGEADETTELIALAGNVKDGPVCLQLREATEVDCALGRHDLVMRTDFREIAPAGFALSTPGIYVASHFLDAQNTQLWSAKLPSIEAGVEAIGDDAVWTRLKDAHTRRADAVLYSSFDGLEVGQTTPAFLHASAQMKLIGWTMEKTGERGFRIAANCVKLQMTKDAQNLPRSADAVSSALEFEDNRVTLVSLCGDDGPAVVSVSPTPYRALWPASDTYDLIIDTLGDTLEVHIPPGHLLMSSGAETIDESTDIPVSFWVNDDIG